MILKSFYRKKTTKIYFIIFVLIMCAFATIIIGKDKYIDELNKNYDLSFIYVESLDYLKLDDVQYVNKVDRAIYFGRYYYMISEESISNNEVIIPSFLKNSYSLNSFIEDENYSFTVKGYYEMEYASPILYVNIDTFEKMVSEKNKKGYIVRINEWNKVSAFLKEITTIYKVEPVTFEINKANIDYLQLISNFTIYSYIVIVIFVLASALTVYNILNDQKEKEYLYSSLGYSKKKIILIQILNIISLYLSTIVTSAIIIFVVKLIFKI